MASLNIASIWYLKFSDLYIEDWRVFIWAKFATYLLKYNIISGLFATFSFRIFIIWISVLSFKFPKLLRNSIHFSMSIMSFIEIKLLSFCKHNSFKPLQSSKEVWNKNWIHSGFFFNSSKIFIYWNPFSSSSLISIPYSPNFFLLSRIVSILSFSLIFLLIFLSSFKNFVTLPLISVIKVSIATVISNIRPFFDNKKSSS